MFLSNKCISKNASRQLARAFRIALPALILLCSPVAKADLTHLGFTVSDALLSAADTSRLEPDMTNSLIEQINIIDGARLPPDVLAFMKTVKIVLDPELRSQPGVFSARNGIGEVRLQPAVFSARRPVLLHELLHAYHFFGISLQNPEVLAAFDVARNDPDNMQFRRAHFLQNPKEFFAVTASIYLSGNVQQPPFTCAAFASKHPAYMRFLEGKFGKRSCI